jgi:hypothetical protein
MFRPAAPRRVGRREGREDDVREHDRVAEAERVAAHLPHEAEGEPPAEAGSLVAEREHERSENEPHGRVRKARERPLDRVGGLRLDEPEDRRHGDSRDANGGRRDRLEDEPHDDGAEQGEEIPGRGLQALRHGQDGDDGAHEDREQAFPEIGMRVDVEVQEVQRAVRRMCLGLHGRDSFCHKLRRHSPGGLMQRNQAIRSVRPGLSPAATGSRGARGP